MIRIQIQSVGEVEVLAYQASVSGRAVVLVDLGDGFRDRYVTWTLGRMDHSKCAACHFDIEKVYEAGQQWVRSKTAFAGQVKCFAEGGVHTPYVDGRPRQPIKSIYHAVNGHYHGGRMAATIDFERRAGYRAGAEV